VTAYTAIFGGYDKPRAAPPGGVLFTDRAPDPRLGWDARIVAPPFPDNLARSNRYFKLQPHRHFTGRVLYLDGGMTLTTTPEGVLAAFQAVAGGDHDVFTLRHSLGHTASDEPDWVLRKGIVRRDVLDSQAQRYARLGVPPDTPTAEARLIIAKLPQAVPFFDAWWGEVREYTHRDQVSFPFAWWSTRADVFLAPYDWGRSLFRHARHAKPQLEGAA
jgi:hypothetical protein